MKYIILKILKVHTLVLLFFILGSIFNFKTPRFIDFYSLELFNQAWDMFSPNPSSSYYKLSFKCHPKDKTRKYSTFGSFIDKQLPKGKHQSIVNDTLILLTYKEERLREGRMRKIDYTVYKEAKSKLTSLLETLCQQEFKGVKKRFQVTYKIDNYEIK